MTTPNPQGSGGGVTSAALDTLLGSTRGSVAVRGASGWTILAPSAANKLLKDGGSGADPSWATLSALIDAALGSTRGQVLRRGASGWEVLALGSSGQVLTSNGTDAAWASAAAGGGPNTVSSGYVADPSISQVTVPYAASPTYTTVGTYDVGVVDGDQVVLFFLVFTASSLPGQAIAELILEASLDNGSTWDPVFYDGEFSTAGAGGYAATVSIPVAVEASSGDHVKFRLRAWVYYGAADSIAFNPSGSGSNGKNWRAATKQ